VQERYITLGNYQFKYAVVLKQMVAERTLLQEDITAMWTAAGARVAPFLPTTFPPN